ncbi:MAG: hypothetical protein MUO82_08085 [Candidatus Thermoplasmatota archaeon]|nr:hypothetical protein [Candidatus Thermoplasmatota archaeon]
MGKINCSDEAIENLRFAVLQKYKKIYGVLKKEVDKALAERTKKILLDLPIEKEKTT